MAEFKKASVDSCRLSRKKRILLLLTYSSCQKFYLLENYLKHLQVYVIVLM